MFLGEDILGYLVLALGAALVAGNVMALIHPPDKPFEDSDLEAPPLGRTLIMIAVGLVAAIWALASLIAN